MSAATAAPSTNRPNDTSTPASTNCTSTPTEGIAIIVTTTPTAFGTSFESMNAVLETGFDNTQEAVPLRFSPTIASIINTVTAMAANIVMTP